MNKFLGFLAIITIMASIFLTAEALYSVNRLPLAKTVYSAAKPGLPSAGPRDIFEVYVDNAFAAGFPTYDEAVAFAGGCNRAAVRQKGAAGWVWDNYLPYDVFTSDNHYEEFETFAEAVARARSEERSFIYYRKNHSLIWSSLEEAAPAFRIEGVPHIFQLPELPSGCEVTSLAMLLRFYGADTDKLALAEQVAKDPTPYIVKGRAVHWGDPNVGFVGDMERKTQSAYGVYHKPIHALAEQYFPDSSLDLTGCEFSDVTRFISGGAPVWVIVNTAYKKLPSSSFVTWEAASGQIVATYSEHAVVVTGYDSASVYFNDPLGKASSAPFQDFAEAWEQMGRQAVAVCR